MEKKRVKVNRRGCCGPLIFIGMDIASLLEVQVNEGQSPATLGTG